ncbi:hypothetical protein [Synechocystis sp. PCC 7509]|uniref:hypothetical protein n=1 Tax=Synechocystis sp. PCC 7509 TaxID=927677 RepID=UPI00048F57C4|nr:hypothetical protein [Synechocystis sp. PCC 7509]
MQENKNSHTYKTSSLKRKQLPLLSKPSSHQEQYCSILGKTTPGGVTPSKAIPLQIIGTNCLAVCLPNNEHISLSWLEARAKK